MTSSSTPPRLAERRLGRTGAKVSELGLGGAGFLINQHCPTSDREAVEIVRLARRHGVSFFDTAPLYRHAGLESEARLGAAGQLLDGAFVATKVGFYVDEEGVDSHVLDARTTRQSIEHSLEALRRETLDLVQIHEFEDSYWDAVFGPRGTLAELRRVQDEGLVRHVGVTGSDVPSLLRAVETDEFDTVQLWRRWTLIDRSGEAVIEAAVARDVGVIVSAPFASGILATGADGGGELHYEAADAASLQTVRALEDRLRGEGVSLKQAAISFCLDERVAVVLTGVDTAQQLRENVHLVADRPARDGVLRALAHVR